MSELYNFGFPSREMRPRNKLSIIADVAEEIDRKVASLPSTYPYKLFPQNTKEALDDVADEIRRTHTKQLSTLLLDGARNVMGAEPIDVDEHTFAQNQSDFVALTNLSEDDRANLSEPVLDEAKLWGKTAAIKDVLDAFIPMDDIPAGVSEEVFRDLYFHPWQDESFMQGATKKKSGAYVIERKTVIPGTMFAYVQMPGEKKIRRIVYSLGKRNGN